jgi:hypothetical protein
VIIAICGQAGAGKSEVASLIDKWGTPTLRTSFAKPMKQFCQRLFGWSSWALWGPSEEREKPDSRFIRPNGEHLTPRFALQTLGTEWGRNCDPDLWAKLTMEELGWWDCVRKEGGLGVIDDLRFENESKLVQASGGRVWRIHRGAAKQVYHASEALDGIVADLHIHNDGSLLDLENMVKGALNAVKAQ